MSEANLEVRVGPMASDFPQYPYPGARPRGSWLLTGEGHVRRLTKTEHGWIDPGSGRHVDISGLHFVLGYGSNLNPAKLAERLGGPVVVLAAKVHGWTAVWCHARRGDGWVPATLAAVPGAVETYAVLCVNDAQLEAMDGWEGHPRWYERQRFTGTCELEDGSSPGVQVYLGTSERRPVLLQKGRPLRCGPSGTPYEVVDALVDQRWPR